MAEVTALQRTERHEDVAGIAPNLFGSPDPKTALTVITEYADALRDVLRKQKLTSKISGKEHVNVEGWTLLGSMLGVFPVLTWSRPLLDDEGRQYGYEARVEAVTRNGEVVGAAEGMCTRRENTWKNRDDYALRSMAQTRATSKALRQPLGFIVILAGYEATPEEEMPGSKGSEANARSVSEAGVPSGDRGGSPASPHPATASEQNVGAGAAASAARAANPGVAPAPTPRSDGEAKDPSSGGGEAPPAGPASSSDSIQPHRFKGDPDGACLVCQNYLEAH